MKRAGKFLLKLTPRESDLFDDLVERLDKECDISSKRQSELIFEGFRKYAEELLATYIPSDTQTKTQRSNLQLRKDYITEAIAAVQEDSYIYLTDAINKFFFGTNVFEGDIRTQSRWFHKFLSSQELSLFYLPYYFDGATNNDFVVIHKKSKWYPQLRKHLFSVKNDFLMITNRDLKFNTYKEKLIRSLRAKAPRFTMDKAENVMFNAFLFEIKKIRENPMYDHNDLVLQEVISLRSQMKFIEAEDLLKQEKEFKKAQKLGADESFKFLEVLR